MMPHGEMVLLLNINCKTLAMEVHPYLMITTVFFPQSKRADEISRIDFEIIICIFSKLRFVANNFFCKLLFVLVLFTKLVTAVMHHSIVEKSNSTKYSRELTSILRMRCCRNYCLHKVSRKEVAQCRNAFQEKKKCEQRQWILRYFLEHHEDSGDALHILYTIGATEVCQRGWRLALGISRTRFWQIQGHFRG